MSATARFDLIVFDWDGTLFDSTALIVRCIRQAVEDVGGTVPDEAAASWVIGLGLAEAMRRAAPDVAQERLPDLVARYRHHYFAAQHEIALFDGVRALVEELQRAGRTLAVATGKSRRGLDEALNHSGLRPYFSATRTAEETAGKPHPQMLFELMEELGSDPDRTLMIGDTTHDLEMARNAGCPAVGVAYGAHDPALLQPLQPLYVAPTVPDLQRWLRERG
ncbi:HAD-IA family hydrolase [Tibeticola sp.]|jgi:phosphoglycolate phosphatase|uniref:HAD family hydrolase n=1 Tax=Tibeticola sp. TaxID=2005368 RepID=UPI00258A1D5E|nr:HAD-IA family hydrolase [Tibeticola sp.]MCI4440059.1 HAD-IA family hydrolase [Tibeticola sp.]